MDLKHYNIIFLLIRHFFVKWKFCYQSFVFIFSVVLLLNSLNASATHISGADISYRWISGNNFELTLTLYRDCSGIAAPSSVSINYKSASCGYNMNVVISKIAGTGNEISQACSSAATVCTGGVIPGIQKYQYSGFVTLPAQCSDWIFSYNICCRNCAITTLFYTPNNCSGVPPTYIEATLNNLASPNNSSPIFTNIPVWLYCIGQTFHYNNGVYDYDGDSIVFSLINPRSGLGTDVIFNAGYTASNPISSSPPLIIESNGDLVVTPTTLEVGVMAILASEYRNGILIGSVVRDMEIWTQSCTNTLPTASGINGTNNYDLVVCPGQSINFSINSVDADFSQSLTMFSNNVIPGSTFNVTSTSRPVGTFMWTPTLADVRSQPYSFTVTVQDDNCPGNGFQTYSYNITVPDFSTSITSVNSNCSSPPTGSAMVQANGQGPFQYLWSNGSTSSSINGLDAGIYDVIVTNPYGCTSQSSVNINSPGALNVSPMGLTGISCNGSVNGSVSVLATGGVSPYTYSWSSGATGATASGLVAGSYTVTVTDANGCTNTMNSTISEPAVLSATISGSNIICFGNQNGAAAVAPLGGTAPYTYTWTNGSTLSSISGLGPGSYSVMITDAHGCIVPKSVLITQPTQINIALSSTASYCNASNGSISSVVSGGTGSYTYNWSPGGFSNPSVSNLAAGSYTVTITDNNGCVKTNSTNVSNFGSPVISVASLSNVKCSGGSDGAVSIILPVGQGPFTYSWSPAVGDSTKASGLPAGNYVISVSDTNNCISSLSIQITEPAPLQTQVFATNPSCNVLNSGSATVNVTGGTSPYSYLWSPGNYSTFSSNNLASGNYKIIISDVSGCTDSASFVLDQTPILGGAINSVTDVTCFGGNNGAAEVSAMGGKPPYSYSWFPGGYTLPVVAGLTSGNYVITISDANNCSTSLSLSIIQPPQLTSAINSFGNVMCTGDNSGFANVQVTGGTQPYTYSWSPTSDSNPFITGLGAGNYSVNITDDHGCNTNSAITISQPVPLSLTAVSVTDVTCYGISNGTVSVSTTGGTAPYTYQWSPPAGNTSTLNNLSAGNYSVTVNDVNGCSDSMAVTINEPPALTATGIISNNTCYNGTDGTIELIPGGGTPPYNYLWTPGTCTSIISTGLTSGIYDVTITDSRGCPFSKNFFVAQPPALTLSFTTTPATCGNSNGSAGVQVTGGTPGYTYDWGSAYPRDSSIYNISAGVYPIIVEDSRGCSVSSSVGISNFLAPEINVNNVIPVTCYGGNDGSAAISLTGGASPFQYTWAPAGGNGLSASSLVAGTYTLTVKDKNQCIAVKTITVNGPSDFNINNHVTSVLCNGENNGSASIEVTGGTGPYNFLWNNGIMNDTAGVTLNAGNYSVTVTDIRGCTASSQIFVTEPPVLSAVINNPLPVSCSGRNDGSATVTVNGGTAPYQYIWNPPVGSGPVVTGLKSGNYSVTITDAMGCTAIAGVFITEPLPLTAQTSAMKGTCDNANGTASVVLSGGTPPYSYLWNQTGETTSFISGLSAGNYMVACADLNGCQTNASVYAANTGMINATLAFVTRVTCNGGNDAAALINVNHGSPPYTYQWQPAGGNSSLATGLAAGSYSVIVKDTNNCSQNISVVVSEPPALSATVIATHVTCAGSFNGSANVIASGGTGSLSYQWQPGGMNTPAINTLGGGNYLVRVTDANACSTETSFIINEPLPLNVSTSSSPAGCNLSNGIATAHSTGGTPPYHYSWNPVGMQDSIYSGIPAGSYSINVTDVKGCMVSASASVSNFNGPAVSITNVKPVNCFGGTDGSAEVDINGGLPPYTYNWFPAGGNATIANNLTAGSYSVCIRDSNNCATTKTVIINQPIRVNTVVTPFAPTCIGGNDGSAIAIAAGGTPPFTYTWSNGLNSSYITNLGSGTVSLNVVDSNRCKLIYTITIPDPPAIAINFISTGVKCFGGTDGSVFADASGGYAPYTYQWSNGSQNPLALNLTADSIKVIVTDAKGCKNDSTIKIEQPDPILLNTISTGISCQGINDGTAQVIAMGGTTPYYYEWLPAGGNSEKAFNMASGIYTVIVRDQNGCMNDTIVKIGSPPPIALAMTSTEPRCYNGNDGHAMVSVTGGIPPYTYFWDMGSTTMNADSLHAGNYMVVVTDNNGCTSQQSIAVSQPLQVLANIVKPDTICIGQQALLEAAGSGGTPGFNFTWNNGVHSNSQIVKPGSTAHYSVYVTDANGCNSTPVTVAVNVHPPLIAAATAPDSICKGTAAVISGLCSGGNGGPYNYTWNNGQSGQYISVSPSATQNFIVTVSDNCGSPPVNASVEVFVNPGPHVNFLPNPIVGCQPFLVDFHDDSDKNVTGYNWSFGDGSSDTVKNPSHLYLNPGNYTVNLIVKDQRGCTGKLEVPSAVIVYPKPWAVFKSEPEIASVFFPEISFFDESINADHLEWTFGDQSDKIKDQKNVIHSYSDTGSYKIRLITISNFGCKDTAFGKVIIVGEFAFYIPNAFSPNNDGTNDIFLPLGIGVKDFYMSIYDRWGLMIFSSAEMTKGWDGRMLGQDNPSPADVYVYKINVVDLQGIAHDYKGHVNLVR